LFDDPEAGMDVALGFEDEEGAEAAPAAPDEEAPAPAATPEDLEAFEGDLAQSVEIFAEGGGEGIHEGIQYFLSTMHAAASLNHQHGSFEFEIPSVGNRRWGPGLKGRWVQAMQRALAELRRAGSAAPAA